MEKEESRLVCLFAKFKLWVWVFCTRRLPSFFISCLHGSRSRLFVVVSQPHDGFTFVLR